MTPIEAARVLGHAIQEDPSYIKFTKLSAESETDPAVQAATAKMQAVQAKVEKLGETEEEPSPETIEALQNEYQAAYQELFGIPLMMDLMDAREALDEIMNDVTQIMFLCVNGENPDTCQPSPETMELMKKNMMGM